MGGDLQVGEHFNTPGILSASGKGTSAELLTSGEGGGGGGGEVHSF